MEKRNLFKKRLEFKPYEYPELMEFKDAIRHAYWLHTEFNFSGDIQNYHVDINSHEKNVITRSMLAISQIEMGVKRFWGDLYYYFPKPEIDLVGATFADSECYSDDTEILTNKGWILFPELLKEVDSDLKVAAYNTFTKNIHFEKPLSYIEKDYKGDMHYYESKLTNICVTENHELFFKQVNAKQRMPFKKKSKEIASARNYAYPSYGYINNEEKTDELSLLERLLIAIQADGTVFDNCPYYEIERSKRISFSLLKERKIERLKYLLRELKISYQEKDGENNQKKFTFTLSNLEQDIFRKIKSFEWVNLNKISYKWGREFIDELSYWDSVRKDELIYYYNSNVKAIDTVQAISILSGYRATKSINRTKEELIKHDLPRGMVRKGARDVYVLSLCDKYDYTNYCEKEIKQYDGKVYCVEVSTGMIITRRKGRVTINGNCRHSDAYAFLIEKLGLNDEFSKIREIPALMGRIEYMEKFMKDKNLDQKGFVLSLVLFSLFIEHISLFSQFLIIMSFNKHKNMFKGMSNAVEATSKEEEIHGKFGIELYRILRTEHSDLFTPEFFEQLIELSKHAFEAEMNIVEWIFDGKDMDFLNRDTVKNYIKQRYNNSFQSLGLDPVYEIDQKLLEETKWFDIELLSTKETDFFNKRSTDYSKKTKTITSDDLF